jgi:hypothetical protein
MNIRHSLSIAFAWLVLFMPMDTRAQSILIAPGSLILTDAQRTGAITVANTEDHTVNYRVEPVLFRMRADGFLEEVATLAQSAASLIRFAPRQFALEPGGSQVIRVAFRAPPDLRPGEYRVHLRMRNMGAPIVAADTKSAAQAASAPGEIQLNVPVTVARAARILVRHETGAGHVAFDAIRLDRVAADAVRVDLALIRQKDGGSATGTVVFAVGDSAVTAKENDLRRRYSVYGDLDRRDYQFIVPIAAGKPATVCVALIPDGSPRGAPAVGRRCASV